MNARGAVLNLIWIGCIVLASGLSGCNGGQSDHPAAALQQALASRLADADACPSGNSEDVQRIVDAAGTGGTASLPAGCYLISKTVNLPPGLKLAGAGADQTILYRDPNSTPWDAILDVRGGKDAPGGTQISGLALAGVRDTDDSGEDFGIVLSNVKDFRIDHCYFEGFGWAGALVKGNSSGVIDHAIFLDNFKRGIDNLGYGVGVYGEDHWKADVQPGGAQAVFIEDSLFAGNRHAVAASAGAQYVFRYNQVLRSIVACAVDAHGMGYGNARGTRFVEIYQNVIEDPVDGWCGIGIRGGAGVIFGNTLEGYENPILLILEWGTPEMFKAKYPAFDQVQELYIWENQNTGGRPVEPRVDETGTGFIEADRDYFLSAMPGYVPYEYPHPLADGGVFDGAPWPPF